MARRHRLFGRVARRALRAARFPAKVVVGGVLVVSWVPIFVLLYLTMLSHSAEVNRNKGVHPPPPPRRKETRRK